jgi:phosphatidylserine/phosphatidylglycerophosphate/cardiolipin synthase-like enzyme
LVGLISPEKIENIAKTIRRTDQVRAAGALLGAVGTPAAATVVEELVQAWQASSVSAEELSSMLLAAGHVFTRATQHQTAELVWTGPTTPFVSTRRTEQALLQVINSAERTLFVTSFVAYNVSAVVMALNRATERGVVVSMLLEQSQGQGGTVTFDVVGKMATLVPAARLYVWRARTDSFAGGSVHSKVAVADGRMCFITSANLTGHAMEKNMEMGVLFVGQGIPVQVRDHLEALHTTNVIERIC